MDCFAAALTVYVPRGGHAPLARVLKKHFEGENIDDLLAVAGTGGKLVLRENQARYGGHSLRESLPPRIDYDHHNDARYEWSALWEFRRNGRVTTRMSTQDADILLSKEDVQKVLKQGRKGLAKRLQRALDVPPATYPVGDAEAEDERD
jgi:hypothetical protein